MTGKTLAETERETVNQIIQAVIGVIFILYGIVSFLRGREKLSLCLVCGAVGSFLLWYAAYRAA
jgi:uncharacterized membrane protein